MSRATAVILLFSFLSMSSEISATSLPPEHEAARLLLALESSVDQNNWNKAEKQLEELSALKVKQPIVALYFSGLVRLQLSDFPQAQEFLEKYVVRAGEAGKYYREALKLITQTEELVRKSKEQKPEIATQKSLTGGQQRDGYIKSLQALYLTDNPIQALVMQVNSLLSSHPFTGSRIKKTGVKEGLVYRLSVKENNLIIQEKSYEKGLPTLSASALSVHGLDPFLRYGCSGKEYACWVYDPANNHERWIKVDYDELVAGELTEALTKLIQKLQKIQ